MPIDQITLTVGTLGYVVLVLLAVLKGFIPSSITGTTQDTLVRSMAIVLGCIGGVSNYLINTAHPTNQGVEGALGLGFSAAMWAFVNYHSYNGDLNLILSKTVSPVNTNIGKVVEVPSAPINPPPPIMKG